MALISDLRQCSKSFVNSLRRYKMIYIKHVVVMWCDWRCFRFSLVNILFSLQKAVCSLQYVQPFLLAENKKAQTYEAWALHWDYMQLGRNLFTALWGWRHHGRCNALKFIRDPINKFIDCALLQVHRSITHCCNDTKFNQVKLLWELWVCLSCYKVCCLHGITTSEPCHVSIQWTLLLGHRSRFLRL